MSKKFLTQMCPKLNTLLIASNSLTGEEFKAILKNASQLHELQISYGSDSIFESIDKMNFELPHLLALDIQYNYGLTDKRISSLTKKTPNLLQLTLRFTNHITDVGLENIAEHCQNLISLELEKCEVTHSGILTVLQKCPNLVSLTIEHCPRIRDEGLEPLYLKLSEDFPHLGFLLH